MPWGGCPLLWALPPAQPLKMGCPRAEVSLPAMLLGKLLPFPGLTSNLSSNPVFYPYSLTQWT